VYKVGPTFQTAATNNALFVFCTGKNASKLFYNLYLRCPGNSICPSTKLLSIMWKSKFWVLASPRLIWPNVQRCRQAWNQVTLSSLVHNYYIWRVIWDASSKTTRPSFTYLFFFFCKQYISTFSNGTSTR